MRPQGIHLSRRTPRRLSGPDASFLAFEAEGRPMHIGAVAWFDALPWCSRGEFDSVRLEQLLARRAGLIPALRLSLQKAPLTGWPYWVEGTVEMAANIRTVEAVTDAAAVRALAEQELARPLDRRQPLWRLVIVPVAGAEQFALILCAHHALVDGIAGIDLLAQLFDGRHNLEDRGPQPAASATTPLTGRHELRRWGMLPFTVVRSAVSVAARPRARANAVRRGVALIRTCIRLLKPGPRRAVPAGKAGTRQVAWFDVEERPLRYARKRLHGSPNDLVLAAVAEALQRLNGTAAGMRGLRAAVPVSTRRLAERFEPGNRIGLMLSPLETGMRGLGGRVAAIGRTTATQKRRGDYEGYEVLGELTAWTGQWSQRLLHRIAAATRSYGILVTNVPGPSRPYRLGGAQLHAVYPLVPLFGGQSLSVAVIRYGSAYRVGVTTSWEASGLADEFASHLRVAFAELARAVPRESGLPVPAPLPHAAEQAT